MNQMDRDFNPYTHEPYPRADRMVAFVVLFVVFAAGVVSGALLDWLVVGRLL